MSSHYPTLVFIPGAWHTPKCYTKLTSILEHEHKIKCLLVTLPSTQDNPNATFKDDIYAARSVILPELEAGRDVVVVAHSYGGLVGNSCIRGLSRKGRTREGRGGEGTTAETRTVERGHVVGLILIATGFNLEGMSMLDPFFGHPPPQWVMDHETGYARLVVDERKFFYHDLPREEGEYWVSQLTTHSLKSLRDGGEHAYTGWKDVPVWYVGTIEDRGLPIAVQRMSLGFARAHGAIVQYTEVRSSHSPFLSCVDECVEVVLDAIRTTAGSEVKNGVDIGKDKKKGSSMAVRNPAARLLAPMTWFRYGLPSIIGHGLGWTYMGFMGILRALRRKR